MLRNLLSAAALILLSTPVWAEGDGPGPNLVIEVSGKANGKIVIDLNPDIAPKAVAQIVALAKAGAYDNVVFHRVIDGFMAQTGDVKYGKKGGDTAMAGMGGSSMADLPSEFSTEAAMGCGFGACLACVLPGSDVPFLVSCQEGPVFAPSRIDWTRCR